MNKILPFFLLSLLVFLSSISYGQEISTTNFASAPIVFKGDTLFVIQNKIGAFSPQQRADMVRQNILQLAKLPLVEFDSLTLVNSGSSTDFYHRKKVIASVTLDDAVVRNKSKLDLAVSILIYMIIFKMFLMKQESKLCLHIIWQYEMEMKEQCLKNIDQKAIKILRIKHNSIITLLLLNMDCDFRNDCIFV
ncbi:MAG: hypothetical protein AB8F94_28515 [Saprospiraceae bacterium]